MTPLQALATAGLATAVGWLLWSAADLVRILYLDHDSDHHRR